MIEGLPHASSKAPSIWFSCSHVFWEDEIDALLTVADVRRSRPWRLEGVAVEHIVALASEQGVVDKSPEAVWDAIADDALDLQWRKGLREMTSDPPGGPAMGTRATRSSDPPAAITPPTPW
ncbi:MAG: hypothetical protein ACRDLS_07995 [Solirubrobacteraceae bacterium]